MGARKVFNPARMSRKHQSQTTKTGRRRTTTPSMSCSFSLRKSAPHSFHFNLMMSIPTALKLGISRLSSFAALPFDFHTEALSSLCVPSKNFVLVSTGYPDVSGGLVARVGCERPGPVQGCTCVHLRLLQINLNVFCCMYD